MNPNWQGFQTPPTSFEQLERILTLLEETKREYVQKQVHLGTALLLFLLSLIGLLSMGYPLWTSKAGSLALPANEQGLFLLVIFLGLGSLLLIGVRLLVDLFIDYLNKRSVYNRRILPAVEVLREVAPALYHTEQWSPESYQSIRRRLSAWQIHS